MHTGSGAYRSGVIPRPLLRPLVAAVLSAGASVALLAGPALAADASIEVVDNAFVPDGVTLELGDTLTFTWVGQNPHGVAGPWGTSHEGCSSSDTEACATTGAAPFLFVTDEVGTFTFHCQVHADMTGTFTVISASPTDLETLEEFVPAVDPDRALASERADAIAAASAARQVTVPRVVALALVLGTVVALVQFILLGPEWITED